MNEPLAPAALDRWRPLQDALIQVLGISLGVVDPEGNPLTRPVDLLRPPWNVLTSSAKGLSRYKECIQSLLKEAQKDPRPQVSIQVGGLHLCAIPVAAEEKPSAYVLIGPCLVGRRGEPDDYIVLSREFDIPIDRWMEALQEIKVLSFVGLNAVVSLLQRLAGVVFQGTNGTEPSLDRLLETALRLVNAESGSILASPGESDELIVQAARGLEEQVVRATRVRVGEGIAGVALREKKSFRIRPHSVPPLLAGMLQRPWIRDAIVIPFLRNPSLPAVLCVSTSRSSSQLSEDGVTSLQQLIQLAQGTLL